MGARKHRTIETDLFGLDVNPNLINSNKKGQKNERQVCIWLYKWTGEPFTRVPSSGGLRWKDNPSVCGDVVCGNAEFKFPFSVETKHLKEITFTEILRANSAIFTIWEQAKRDAERARKTPMLILRKNGMPAQEFVVFVDLPTAKVIHKQGIQLSFHGKNTLEEQIFGYHSAEILEVPFDKFVF